MGWATRMLTGVAVSMLATQTMAAPYAPGLKWMSGETLSNMCRNEKSAGCAAYVVGIADMHGLLLDVMSPVGAPPLFCLPRNAQAGQLVDVVREFLTKNPQVRHEPAIDLVYSALASGFPCDRR